MRSDARGDIYRFSGSRRASKMKRRKRDGDVKKRVKNAEIFKERLKIYYPDYEILGEYRDRNTEVLLRCKVHDIAFLEKPGNIFKRNKLPKCPECLRLERCNNFINYIKVNYPDIDAERAQENFVDFFTPINLYCKIHPKESIILSPEQVMGKNGHSGLPRKFLCNSCKAKDNIKNWIAKFTMKFPNHNFDFSNSEYVVDHYPESGNPIARIHNILCKDCGKIFSARSCVLLNSGRCPECCINKSTGEIFVESWLESNNLDFIPQLKISNDLIEGKFKQSGVIVDFSVQYKNKQYWIEYNGEQHYTWCQHFQSLEKFEGQLKRDSNVRNYCKNNDIILIEIPYKYYTKESVWKLLNDIIINGISPDDIISYPEIKYNRKVGG